jgi:hypothetical protein
MALPLGHHFRSAAHSAFGWLERELGFGDVSLEDDLVEFRSRTAFFIVARVGAPDPSYKLLDSTLGPSEASADVTQGYSLRDIARHLEPDENEVVVRSQLSSGRFPANSAEEMEESLARLAREWHDRLELLPLEDTNLWASLRSEAVVRIMELADDDPRGKAIEAFGQGEYAAVLALYDRMPGSLTPADRKRIAISRKALGEH